MSTETNPSVPTVETPIQAEQPQIFDIDKALNSRGFLSFLEAHPDYENTDMEDAEAMEKKFQVFQALEKVRPEVLKDVTQRIQKDTDIRIAGDEQKELTESLNRLAVENPEVIERWAERVKNKQTRESLDAEIKKLREEERAISPFAGEEEAKKIEAEKTSLEMLQRALESAESKKRDLPLMRRLTLDKDARAGQKLAKQIFGKDWRKKIDEIEEHIEKTRKTLDENIAKNQRAGKLPEEMKTTLDIYWQAHRDLGALMDQAEAFREIIRRKVEEKIDYMLDQANSLKGLIQATEYLDKLQEPAQLASLEALDADGVATTREWIDKQFEGIVSAEIQQKITDFELPPSNALSKLEGALKDTINSKAVGGRSEEEVKAFVTECLETVAANKETHALKGLLIKRLIIKLNR